MATARAAQSLARTNWSAGTQLTGFAAKANCQVKPFSVNAVTEITVATDDEFSLTEISYATIPEGFVGAGERLEVLPGSPTVEWICGPVQPLGGGRFRIALDRTWRTGAACYLVSRNGGSEDVRLSIQPAMVRLLENREGLPQSITFERIPDVRAGTTRVPLRATSDSGMSVSFYVESGPAIVKDDALMLTTVPPRARYPVEVTVAAWQWGRHAEPKVQGAPIVKQTFMILAP